MLDDAEARTLSWGDPLVTGSWSPGTFVLPAGTVTFLLTDVETSTKMWELESVTMAAAISRHLRFLDAAITSHNGVRPLEQGEGDSVVAAFSRTSPTRCWLRSTRSVPSSMNLGRPRLH